MTDIITPVILDTLSLHLRRCAVLTQDPQAVDILMTAARALDDRADDLREEAHKTLHQTSDENRPR